MTYSVLDLQKIFNNLFSDKYNTILLTGGLEPFYNASKSESEKNKIICRSDYFSSALHEISHWCIAGKQRRLKDDFAYWYSPDGRDAETQTKFYQVESKPQAIERIFSIACGINFYYSFDNLINVNVDKDKFMSLVDLQTIELLNSYFPKRAKIFTKALASFYKNEKRLEAFIETYKSKNYVTHKTI
jgi:elongation factor P hydroxylase